MKNRIPAVLTVLSTLTAHAAPSCPSLDDTSFPQEAAVSSTTCPVSDNPSLTWITKKCSVTDADTGTMSSTLKGAATKAAQAVNAAGNSATSAIQSATASGPAQMAVFSAAGSQVTNLASAGDSIGLSGLNTNLATVTADLTAHKANLTEAQSRHNTVAIYQGQCGAVTGQLTAAKAAAAANPAAEPALATAQAQMAQVVTACNTAYGITVPGVDCNSVCGQVDTNLTTIESEQNTMITKLQASNTDGAAKTGQLASCVGIDDSSAIASATTAQSYASDAGSFQTAQAQQIKIVDANGNLVDQFSMPDRASALNQVGTLNNGNTLPKGWTVGIVPK